MGAKPRKAEPAAQRPAGKTRQPASRVPPRRAAGARGRMGEESVESYVTGLSGPLAGAAERLRQLILGAAPSASESIKWGQPVYEDNGPFCYFKAHTNHITFGFWRGTELDDPAGRLEGDGEWMKHLAIRTAEEIDENSDSIAEWIQQAVALNRELGSPTQRGRDTARAQEAAASEAAASEAPASSDDESAEDEAEEVDPAQIESVQSIEDDDSFDTSTR